MLNPNHQIYQFHLILKPYFITHLFLLLVNMMILLYNHDLMIIIYLIYIYLKMYSLY